jgi:hypothetical protein
MMYIAVAMHETSRSVLLADPVGFVWFSEVEIYPFRPVQSVKS